MFIFYNNIIILYNKKIYIDNFKYNFARENF